MLGTRGVLVARVQCVWEPKLARKRLERVHMGSWKGCKQRVENEIGFATLTHILVENKSVFAFANVKEYGGFSTPDPFSTPFSTIFRGALAKSMKGINDQNPLSTIFR